MDDHKIVRYMTEEEIQAILDRISFRPFGEARWNMEAHLDDLMDPTHFELKMEHWVADSRGFEHWDEFFEPELHPQTFTTIVPRPFAGDERPHFAREVLRLAIEAMAHEACEWFVVDEEILHDPHTDGDPTVRLP